MKILTAHFTTEIIGLTILFLMAAALIAGQANATLHETAHSDGGYAATSLGATVDAVLDAARIRADVELRLELGHLINAAGDGEADAVLGDLIRVVIRSDD